MCHAHTLNFFFYVATITIALKDTPISHKRKTSIIMEEKKNVGEYIGQQGLLESLPVMSFYRCVTL